MNIGHEGNSDSIFPTTFECEGMYDGIRKPMFRGGGSASSKDDDELPEDDDTGLSYWRKVFPDAELVRNPDGTIGPRSKMRHEQLVELLDIFIDKDADNSIARTEELDKPKKPKKSKGRARGELRDETYLFEASQRYEFPGAELKLHPSDLVNNAVGIFWNL